MRPLLNRASREITTTGYAVVPVKPDRVTVELELTALEPTTKKGHKDVATRSEDLQRILDELSVEPHERRTAGVDVREEWDSFLAKRRLLSHRATNCVVVTLDDADKVGELVRLATERTIARVTGPRWEIARENPARLE